MQTPGQAIKALAVGQFVRLTKIAPAGALEARKLASGATTFYWRCTMAGKAHREVIGIYDPGAAPKSLQPTNKGFSVTAAIRAAEALASTHHANKDAGGIRAVREAEKAAQAEAQAARNQASKFTLAALLIDYCDHLEALGRRSHKDARSMFNLHVIGAWPKVAALPAAEVTGEQIADAMRRLVDMGKDRTANKLRSYARAAYEVARTARSKASVPVRFKGYNIRSNPAADTGADEAANRADKNPLSASELRSYWHVIKGMEGARGAALRLHLLAGGQRIGQLVRLRTADIGDGVVTLFDGKGRPGKPARPHTVPLVPEAAAALRACHPTGDYAISTDGGKTHLAPTTLSAWAVEAGAAAGIEGFQAKRIRSGVETLLASARVSSDVRGRLQSHGIAGVQARHYDAHDYLPEKLHALETLHRLLDAPEADNVLPLLRSA